MEYARLLFKAKDFGTLYPSIPNPTLADYGLNLMAVKGFSINLSNP